MKKMVQFLIAFLNLINYIVVNQILKNVEFTFHIKIGDREMVVKRAAAFDRVRVINLQPFPELNIMSVIARIGVW
jgi:DNA gyrase inhibitor GyrI